MEIGFGLGISADKIQDFNIDEHVIIECNEEVFKRLVDWSKKQKHKVSVTVTDRNIIMAKHLSITFLNKR